MLLGAGGRCWGGCVVGVRVVWDWGWFYGSIKFVPEEALQVCTFVVGNFFFKSAGNLCMNFRCG